MHLSGDTTFHLFLHLSLTFLCPLLVITSVPLKSQDVIEECSSFSMPKILIQVVEKKYIMLTSKSPLHLVPYLLERAEKIMQGSSSLLQTMGN